MNVPASRDTVAFGIDLRLTTTAEGGRRTPLLGGWDRDQRFNYRPNWGLPTMTLPEQTGAPVFAFSRRNIAPGETCRAVIDERAVTRVGGHPQEIDPLLPRKPEPFHLGHASCTDIDHEVSLGPAVTSAVPQKQADALTNFLVRGGLGVDPEPVTSDG